MILLTQVQETSFPNYKQNKLTDRLDLEVDTFTR